MMQIKKRSDFANGIRFMLTICFYQDSRHEKPLFWIRETLKAGYISKRNDGMTELRIQGYALVERVLHDLLPFLQFKKVQAVALLESARLLQRPSRKEEVTMRLLIDHMLVIQTENYATRRKRSREELLSVIGLTP